jgi:hypothetical protein
VPPDSDDVISPGRQYVATLLEFEVGRDQRAAPLASLDHHLAAESPAMIRFRAGKRRLVQVAGLPPAPSSQTTPRPHHHNVSERPSLRAPGRSANALRSR